MASDPDLLRLHVDHDGFVWYGDDTQLGVNTFLEPADFITSSTFLDLQQSRHVRLLGIQANAPLITTLHTCRTVNQGLARKQRVQLCSPVVIPTEVLRQDPEAVLQQLWQPTYSSSLHGLWHELTATDYTTYAMIMQLQREQPDTEALRRMATYHPGWSALSFVRSLNPDYACRLLCEIVDPRWYRHPSRPERLSRLNAYLGLTPRNLRASCGEGTPGHNYERSLLALRVWYAEGAFSGVSQHPRDFLWRVVAAARERWRGLLHATRKLVQLLAAVWSFSVTPAHPEVAFSPVRFFRNEEESTAFLRFLS